MTKHLLAIRNMDVQHIERLLTMAQEFKAQITAGKKVTQLTDLTLGLLFFEDSTRTRVSFEQAANYLGLRSVSFAASGSSMNKGESLKDTILTLRHERLNGLVMRHKSSGAPYLAARYFGGPVINAGDGQHEHPTQALGDAMTILERKGKLNGLRVAIVGDVEHSRVARSNVWLLHKMGANVNFVGPRTLIPSHTGMLPAKVFYDLATGIEGADVIISLRLQRERMQSGLVSSINSYRRQYQINAQTVRYASKDCLVMHPGPINRGIEVDDVVADGENSAISQQIENGIYVRMAALYWSFEGSKNKGVLA